MSMLPDEFEAAGIQGSPDSQDGKVSYGGTTERQEKEKQEKQDEGFPAGSYGESSEGGEQNIIDEDAPSE
jgi:hypothetical protein